MTPFQVVQVGHSPLSMLSWLLSLLDGIGNIQRGLYDPPSATPGLKELLPLDPDSVSAPHLVSTMNWLTIVLSVIIGLLRFLCLLEVCLHQLLCFLHLRFLLNNILCHLNQIIVPERLPCGH